MLDFNEFVLLINCFKNLIMKKTLLLFLAFFAVWGINAQVNADFESGLPDGWSIDGGWKLGNAASLKSDYFPFTGNETKFLGTNDDGAGQSGHADGRVITGFMDFTSTPNVFLQFDLYFFHGNYNDGGQETFSIYYSEDGTTWNQITSVETFYVWKRFYYDVSSFVGNKNVKIAFEYKDGNNWNYGAGIDNVSISEQPDYFAVVYPPAQSWTQIDNPGETGSFSFTVNYFGKQSLSNFKMVYTIDDGDEKNIMGDGTLNSNDSYEFVIDGFELGDNKFKSKFVMNDSMEMVAEELTLSVVPPIPPFAFTDVDGVAHDLHADLAAGKKVLLDFFASWCGPCKTSTPIINQVWDDHGRGANEFQVYSITTESGDNASVVKGLGWGGEYPAFAYTPQNRLMWNVFNSKYGQNAIPMFIMLCPDKENPGFSEVSWTAVGVAGTLQSDLENAISACVVPDDPGVYFVDDNLLVNKNTSDDVLIEMYVNNTSTESMDVFWKLDKPDFNHSWESQVCDINLCYGNNTDQCSVNKPNTIAAGDTALWTIHVFHHDIPDTGMVVMKIYDDKNFTNLIDSLPINIQIATPNATVDFIEGNKINVYPNPASDKLYVKLNMIKETSAEVNITDQTGKVVRILDSIEKGSNYFKQVDVSDLIKGVYFLNVKTGYGTKTQKIIKL